MAGGIRTGGKDIRFVGDMDQENIVRYCSNCDMNGFKSKLGPRILRPNEQITPDFNYYVECHTCGKLEPKEAARVESDISDVVERNDSDNDYAISLDDPRLSRRGRHYNILRWD